MLILFIKFILSRFCLLMRLGQGLRTFICGLGICLLCSLSAENSLHVAFADELDTQIEDAVEAQVEGQVDEEVESLVDDEVETLVDDEVEGQVEDEVEGQVENEVEELVEDEVEGHVAGQVDEEVERLVEDEVEGHVERHTDDFEIDGHFERNAEMDHLSSGEIDHHISTQNSAADNLQEERKPIASVSTDELRDERSMDAAIEIIETSAGIHRIAGSLILVTDNFQRDELEKQGLEITNVTELKGLSQFLIEVKESSTHLQPENNRNLEFNDLYTLQGDSAKSLLPEKKSTVSSKQLKLAENLASFSTYLSANPVRIGVIDSGIDLTHYAFKDAKIHAQSFVVGGNPAPETHGTAITSLLVGRSETMRGLIPSAEIYHANVFFSSQDNKQYASIKSLILALNWMVENNVEVINMSLSGPSNPILEKTLAKVRSRGILLVAAAGNNGPSGAPAFPAAYKSVIAVTAVNQNNFAYFNANRGAYIDVAALGVDVFHAIPKNLYETSTGTSYAVPFVTAISAALLRQYRVENIEEIIFKSALDLGEEGKDNVYGYGLAQLTTRDLNNSLSLLESGKL